MRIASFLALAGIGTLAFAACSGSAGEPDEIPPPKEEPRVIDAGPPPSDTIVLFDGKELTQSQSQKDSGPARWEVSDGVATINGSRGIATREGFGDCQLHIEWASPAVVR